MDDNTFLKQMGKRIAELRKEKEWTQEQFSEKLGIKRSALARIETGTVNCSINLVRKIAANLKVSLAQIAEFN